MKYMVQGSKFKVLCTLLTDHGSLFTVDWLLIIIYLPGCY